MAEVTSSHEPATFGTQADALLRKNLTYQKRNVKANCRLIFFPFIFCIILALTQELLDKELNKASNKCGCVDIDTDGDGRLEKVCGLQYSTLDQVATCAIPSPPQWPPLLQVPAPEYRAVRSDVFPSADLPNDSCRRTGSCPAIILVTGNNQSLGEALAVNMFPSSFNLNSSSAMDNVVLGSDSEPENNNFLDSAFLENSPIYNVQRQCTPNSTFSVSVQSVIEFQKEVACVQGVNLWRNSSSEVNEELYKGYRRGNSEEKINEILAAYDLLNSDRIKFNVSVWYNSTYKENDFGGIFNIIRVPRAVNLVSNAYLQFFQGTGTKMLFEFVKEMPKAASKINVDLASLLGTLFFTWVVLQLFPVVLTSLVYEKQQKLRIMMKMHGLGDGPYWIISYAYFLSISLMYMLVFVIFGSLLGLKFFTLNDYSIQFVFYFLYINLQISVAFLVAALFSNVKTATVVSYICIFGTGLLGGFLFENFVEDSSFPRNAMGKDGMRWGDLSDSKNGMKEVIIIMFLEWLLGIFVAYYVDQVSSSGSGKSPLFFLQSFRKKHTTSFRRPSLKRQGSKVLADIDKPDVIQERERVEQLLLEPSTTHAIVCDNLRKVYPGRDGNPEKLAVRGLSLALPPGECFGMLGPNGAGKTSFISMMIGLTKPTSGAAYVQGLDIGTHMNWIYTSMGVCPQHDLLWETLTGREHLLFYGRLKNLKGTALTQAVEESLRSVNLFNGGVADKHAGKYSGGMKRRLSVAISLIGDPKVVYMDEPSTGLDPASRSNLWNVVKRAKQDRAIILTTHSMEEADALCDRLGVFVDGSLQCIGNPKELKARYGGSYVFTMTTSSDYEQEVVNMVQKLSPNAERIYHTSGTQKFEMPKHEVKIADVFHAVETAKSRFSVFAWGLSDTTLEDVFIKVANTAQPFSLLT
ncbi:ABC transporter A family member 7-like isoform X2 [Mercurialis annua]|uniref:ABC transporter A family member 7-like isoform X2 n=1 Tax=Mercurialis annua TaxID=3986 RepID=UPI00215F5855|nr:ABC transporter A family member 7-like isoform X2 [Mercurialis annua]